MHYVKYTSLKHIPKTQSDPSLVPRPFFTTREKFRPCHIKKKWMHEQCLQRTMMLFFAVRVGAVIIALPSYLHHPHTLPNIWHTHCCSLLHTETQQDFADHDLFPSWALLCQPLASYTRTQNLLSWHHEAGT